MAKFWDGRSYVRDERYRNVGSSGNNPQNSVATLHGNSPGDKKQPNKSGDNSNYQPVSYGSKDAYNGMLHSPVRFTENQQDSVGSSGSAQGYGSSGYGQNAPYVSQLNALYDQIMNRKPFQYDLNGDMLYRQMADEYSQLGRTAMRDAMGQASALTGGYGNSYAQQVGNQANQQYLMALNEQIPALYDRAFNVWQAEGDDLLQRYQLAASHPSYLEALSPSLPSSPTETTENSSEDPQTYMQYLQGILNNGLAANGKLPQNELNEIYYKYLNYIK